MASAIDIHHHYFPPSILEEAKRHGKALGVEIAETKNGESSVSFAGTEPHGLNRDLRDVEKRLTIMDKGKIALAAAEALTAGLGYPLDGKKGESWCRLYNEGFRELVQKHPDRFTALAGSSPSCSRVGACSSQSQPTGRTDRIQRERPLLQQPGF